MLTKYRSIEIDKKKKDWAQLDYSSIMMNVFFRIM